MITNPQSFNRLGHFLTPDYKSRGTPSGLAFLIKRGITKNNQTDLKRLPSGVPADLKSAVKKGSTY